MRLLHSHCIEKCLYITIILAIVLYVCTFFRKSLLFQCRYTRNDIWFIGYQLTATQHWRTPACWLITISLICDNSVTTTPSQQHCHNNSVTTTPSQQQCHNNTVTTPSQQHRHNNSVTTTPSQQQCHNNSVTTTPSQQQCHNNTITTTQSQQHRHNNTVTTPSQQHCHNSKFVILQEKTL